MINYNHLYYFHVAAEESAIGRAAERLGVTQPTVSEQIRRLEDTLGAHLFERTTTGLKLTDAGRRAFEHSTTMFRAGERLLASFAPERSAPASLSIGIASPVSRCVAASFLFPLLAVPDWVPDISLGETTELLHRLRGNELDLVLTDREPIEPARRGLQVVTLVTMPLVAVAAATVLPADDWNDVGIIHFRLGSAYRWEVEAYLDERGLRPQRVCETDDGVFMIEALQHGAFIAFVPLGLARDGLATGRLRELARTERGTATVHALYLDAEQAIAARRAVELLAEHEQQKGA